MFWSLKIFLRNSPKISKL